MSRPRPLPTGIKGLNLVPTQAQIAAGSPVTSAWAQFWGDFVWSGPTGFKGQIDFAKSIGCNAIRCIGDGGCGVFTGAYSLASYLGKQSEVINYCHSRGLYYYLTIGGQNQYQGYQAYPGGDGTPTGFGAVVAFAKACVEAAAGFPNVIGVDLCQEVYSVGLQGMGTAVGPGITEAQVGSLMAELVAMSHATAPNLSATFSWTEIDYRMPLAAGYSDHIDMHCYYPLSPGQVRTELAKPAYAGKQLLCGEHGWAQSNGASSQVSQFDSVRANLTDDPTIPTCGGLAWAAIPQDTVGGSDDYGLGDLSGVARPIGSHYAAYPANPARIPTHRRRRHG